MVHSDWKKLQVWMMVQLELRRLFNFLDSCPLTIARATPTITMHFPNFKCLETILMVVAIQLLKLLLISKHIFSSLLCKLNSVWCFYSCVNGSWQLILLLINRCLEEGAEDYLVKPVKLSDVKRLKDFIIRGEGKDGGETRIRKRRRQDDHTSLPQSVPLSSSPALAFDPLSTLMPSSSPSACSSKRAKLRI